MYKTLCVPMLSVFLGMYLEVQLLGCVRSRFDFIRNWQTVLWNGCAILYPKQQRWRILVAPEFSPRFLRWKLQIIFEYKHLFLFFKKIYLFQRDSEHTPTSWGRRGRSGERESSNRPPDEHRVRLGARSHNPGDGSHHPWDHDLTGNQESDA